jgi:hypothetical protein
MYFASLKDAACICLRLRLSDGNLDPLRSCASLSITRLDPLFVHSFQSFGTGFSVDFYIRNVLNTLVRFRPFLSFFVHALLDITLSVDCFLLTTTRGLC